MCQQHSCLICFWHYAGSSVLSLHLVMVMMLKQSSLTLKSVLKLISERVMLVPECKRSVTHILNALLLEKGTDATVLLCLLDMRKDWIEDDFFHSYPPLCVNRYSEGGKAVSRKIQYWEALSGVFRLKQGLES
ncbi:hypothetical protein V6N13_111626 [Hibiscus sabdariffa]|uniref:Uncharacterized protein n=1 Tax=Hibiscus sabdariffa TaxID=183260 RepID=A0ABR2TKT6_9ROSI